MLLFFFVAVTVMVSGQVIPSSRTVNLSNAGYTETMAAPSTVIDVTGFGGLGDSVTDNSPFLLSAINSLAGNRGVIYFPPGNFIFRSPIDLPDSVILRGASSDSTHLIFDFAGAAITCITVSGSANFNFTNTLSGFDRGSSWIRIADTSGFTAGTYAEIQEENGSWDTQPVSWADHSVGQIIHVDSISGDTLFFSEPLRINFDSALNVQVRKFIPATEAGIECLNILRRDSVAAGFCVNIYFDHAVNCRIRGIESSRSVGSHVEIEGSSHIEITGSYFHHAFAYDGTSTHGYGITLNKHASDCKLENNIMKHLRHSFSMQCGANGNVIAYNYSIEPNRSEFPSNFGADISLHGHFTFCNLFEGNIVQNIQIDSIWGPTGPFNTFFRNRAELYGLFMISGTVSSDSENFVGNEITNMGLFMGNYILAGSGHINYGNNVRGTIVLAGTTTLNETSYYLSSAPSFWNSSSTFPSIGEPNVFGSGSIPARDRYLAGVNLTVCSESIFTGTHADESIPGQLLLYPNPANNFLKVVLPVAAGKNIYTQLSDISGRKLAEENFYFVKADTSFLISIPGTLSRGIYIITVLTENKVFTGKIVLN